MDREGGLVMSWHKCQLPWPPCAVREHSPASQTAPSSTTSREGMAPTPEKAQLEAHDAPAPTAAPQQQAAAAVAAPQQAAAGAVAAVGGTAGGGGGAKEQRKQRRPLGTVANSTISGGLVR